MLVPMNSHNYFMGRGKKFVMNCYNILYLIIVFHTFANIFLSVQIIFYCII